MSENLASSPRVSRAELVQRLNDDLSREYQAIIAYVVFSQSIKGAEYMNAVPELKVIAGEELAHAMIITSLIEYLGGVPTVVPKAGVFFQDAHETLVDHLNNECEAIRQYRERVRQCEALGEYAMAEHIWEILVEEQDHQVSLATALGFDALLSSDDER